jgi:hypothetical protein
MKIRNKNENAAYVQYLKDAIAQVKQASDCVSYECHPELNKRLIAKLDEITHLLDTCTTACVFKP